MKKIFLFLLFMISAVPCFADLQTVTIPTTNWTQEQKNYRESCTSSLVYKATNVYSKPFIKGDDITVDMPTGYKLSEIIDEQKLLDEYALIKQQNAQATAAAKIAYQNRLTSLKSTVATAGINWDELVDIIREEIQNN